jgi:hypothetical protein
VRFLGRLSAEIRVICKELFHGFRKSLQAYAGIVLRIEQKFFLRNLSKFFIQQLSHHSMVHSLDTDSVVTIFTPKIVFMQNCVSDFDFEKQVIQRTVGVQSL